VQAAQAAVGLADAQGWPDLALGVSYAKEEASKIVVGGISLPLPLFNRNQGQRAQSRATLLRLQAQRQAKGLAIESEVRRAYTDYKQARDALQLYSTEVLRAQQESLEMLQRALEAGEVDYADVIVVQREVLDGKEGLLDARLSFAQARARVLSSSGLQLEPPTPGENP